MQAMWQSFADLANTQTYTNFISNYQDYCLASYKYTDSTLQSNNILPLRQSCVNLLNATIDEELVLVTQMYNALHEAYLLKQSQQSIYQAYTKNNIKMNGSINYLTIQSIGSNFDLGTITVDNTNYTFSQAPTENNNVVSDPVTQVYEKIISQLSTLQSNLLVDTTNHITRLTPEISSTKQFSYVNDGCGLITQITQLDGSQISIAIPNYQGLYENIISDSKSRVILDCRQVNENFNYWYSYDESGLTQDAYNSSNNTKLRMGVLVPQHQTFVNDVESTTVINSQLNISDSTSAKSTQIQLNVNTLIGYFIIPNSNQLLSGTSIPSNMNLSVKNLLNGNAPSLSGKNSCPEDNLNIIFPSNTDYVPYRLIDTEYGIDQGLFNLSSCSPTLLANEYPLGNLGYFFASVYSQNVLNYSSHLSNNSALQNSNILNWVDNSEFSKGYQVTPSEILDITTMPVIAPPGVSFNSDVPTNLLNLKNFNINLFFPATLGNLTDFKSFMSYQTNSSKDVILLTRDTNNINLIYGLRLNATRYNNAVNCAGIGCGRSPGFKFSAQLLCYTNDCSISSDGKSLNFINGTTINLSNTNNIWSIQQTN